MPAARFRIAGRVQGVGFRAATRAEGARLGLAVQAENRADGTVEGRAAGDAAAIDALARWLQHGPPLARVVCVERLPVAPEAP